MGKKALKRELWVCKGKRKKGGEGWKVSAFLLRTIFGTPSNFTCYGTFVHPQEKNEGGSEGWGRGRKGQFCVFLDARRGKIPFVAILLGEAIPPWGRNLGRRRFGRRKGKRGTIVTR